MLPNYFLLSSLFSRPRLLSALRMNFKSSAPRRPLQGSLPSHKSFKAIHLLTVNGDKPYVHSQHYLMHLASLSRINPVNVKSAVAAIVRHLAIDMATTRDLITSSIIFPNVLLWRFPSVSFYHCVSFSLGSATLIPNFFQRC